MVKHLPGMCETLSSVPSTGKKGKKRRRKGEKEEEGREKDMSIFDNGSVCKLLTTQP